MQARPEAQLNMLRATNTYNTETGPLLPGIVIFNTFNGQLTSLLSQIDAKIVLTETSTTGITANKLALRREMEAQSAALAGKLYAYALNFNLPAPPNTDLATQVAPWKRKSDYVPLFDNVTNAKARIIYELALAIDPADLVAYGVIETVPPAPPDPAIPGTVDLLLAAIEAYEATIELPEAAIEQRKADNQILQDLFDQANEKVRFMDDLVYDLQFSEEVGLRNWWLGYKAARVIFDPVTTSTGFRGTVTDGFTLLPIQGIKVTATPATIDPPGEAGVPVETFTDVNGYYTLATPQYKNNPYALRFQKEGYETFIKNDLYQQRGKKQTIDVPMLTVTP